jgi:hypothetical protein
MKQVLTDVRLFAGGADLSGASNKAELSTEFEEKDATNYRSAGYKEVMGGLASSTINGEGFWEAGDPSLVDDASWAMLGGRTAWTIGPNDATVGALAYLTFGLDSSYKFLGEVGEIAPWSAKVSGSWPVARGQFAHPPGTARTATGVGTGVQLPAVPAGQRVYASLHVLSVSGTTPSITARVESATTNAFSSPTTRATFTAANARGGEIIRTTPGAITDTWWRLAWTISGSTPSFLLAAAVGIAP